MPGIYIDIRTHLRARGQTAAGAVAYAFGAAVRDARGQVHNFASRHDTGDIVATSICSARATPIARSTQALCDAIEAAERRCDARILRTITIALPAELTARARTRLATDFAACVAARYDTVVPVAVHKPDPDGDVRNHHAHLIVPTRALAADGRQLGAKLRQLDLATRSGDEVAAMRNEFADLTNRALKRARVRGARRDAGRAIDAVVVPKAGAAIVALARKSARRRGERVRRRPAAELVAAAVAAGDLDGPLALEVARTHRLASRSPGRRHYEPRARSRRARRVDARQRAKLAAEVAANPPTAPAVVPTTPATPADTAPVSRWWRRRRRRRRERAQSAPAPSQAAPIPAADPAPAQGAPAPSPAAPATPIPEVQPDLPDGLTPAECAQLAAEAAEEDRAADIRNYDARRERAQDARPATPASERAGSGVPGFGGPARRARAAANARAAAKARAAPTEEEEHGL